VNLVDANKLSNFSMKLQRFKLPETAPQWEKNLVFLLQNKLRVPGIDVHLLSTTEIMLAFLVVTKECDRVTLFVTITLVSRYPVDGNFLC
jgi:hypothetical protein